MGKKEKKRDDFIDILRGLGIIAVVLGHVCISEFYYSELSDGIRRFCYMFHLPLFFFCAGYLYRRIGLREKIVKIIRSYYFPFIVIGLISIGCYPIWRALGITESETLMQLAKRVLGVFAFRIDGFFIQPMWFLCFFAVCQLEYWAFDALIDRQKYVLRLLVAFVIGIAGMGLVHFFGKGVFYVFLSLTMIPLIEIGGGITGLQITLPLRRPLVNTEEKCLLCALDVLP